MENRTFPSYRFLTISIIVILFMIIAGSFAGAALLAPYLGSDAQAASAPLSQQAIELAAQLDETEIVGAYEQALIDLYRTTSPSVVNIRVTVSVDPRQFPQSGLESPFPFFQGPPGEEFFEQGQGSGFVWDKAGHIVTNYHVVANATAVEVAFADGQTAEAEVLGGDPNADLAVIRVDLPATELQPLVQGDSNALQVGQLVIAIGSPFGQEFTMTNGIISAVERTIPSGNTAFSIPEVIQTDAAINPGNSGGPLLDRQGRVIGINTLILSQSGANAGVGFALPINIAKQVVPTLIEGETYQYSWLGITGTTLTSAVIDLLNLPPETRGALVIAVAQGSPADEAGIQGSDKTFTVASQDFQLGGDIITAINDQPVDSMDDLISYLIENTQPGDQVQLDLIHLNGQSETVTVNLGVRPEPDEISQQNQ